jgi:hypothetical protein
MKRSLFLLALAGTLTVALAQRPMLTEAGSASYVCGGVGLDEQQEMKNAARGHDLMLTFATSTGAYVADVNVDIRNSRGDAVLNVQCGGPIMLVDLPAAGSYRITAEVAGVARQRTVKVARAGHLAAAVFVWPEVKG